MRGCPYTPLTRLHVVMGEERGSLEAVIQQLLCLLYRDANVDAVPLVYTLYPDELESFLEAARRLAHGGVFTSHVLGVLAAGMCDSIDGRDAQLLGYVDTFAVREGEVECTAILPAAIAECIPRGVSALVIARFRWEAKLLIAALSKRGYRRIIVALPEERVPEAELAGLDKMFSVNIEPITPELIRHYTGVVDLIVDLVGVELRGSTAKTVSLRIDNPSRHMACILGVWAARALLFIENVFVESAAAAKMAESLLGTR